MPTLVYVPFESTGDETNSAWQKLFEAESINFKGSYWRLQVSQSCYTKNLIYYMTNGHYVELWTRFLEVYLLFSYTKKD